MAWTWWRKYSCWVLILILHTASDLVVAAHSVIVFFLLLGEERLNHLDLVGVIRALVSKFAEQSGQQQRILSLTLGLLRVQRCNFGLTVAIG